MSSGTSSCTYLALRIPSFRQAVTEINKGSLGDPSTEIFSIEDQQFYPSSVAANEPVCLLS